MVCVQRATQDRRYASCDSAGYVKQQVIAAAAHSGRADATTTIPPVISSSAMFADAQISFGCVISWPSF